MKFLRVTTARALQLLPHRNYDQAQTIVVAGNRGQGKTVLQKGYLERTEPRVLELDIKHEYENLRYRVDANEALDELKEGGPLRRRIAPPVRLGSRVWAEAIFRRILDEEIENFLLGMDELSRWTSPRHTEAFEAIITQARDIGVRTIIGCQRFAQVPTSLRSEATEVCLFHMAYHSDLEAVEDWFGPEIRETVPKLSVGECLLMLDL